MYVYNVVYHTNSHEMQATVIADSRLHASNLVDGKVMHVGEPRPLEYGIQSSSGWNLMYESSYKEPSDEWKEYLININLDSGHED